MDFNTGISSNKSGKDHAPFSPIFPQAVGPCATVGDILLEMSSKKQYQKKIDNLMIFFSKNASQENFEAIQLWVATHTLGTTVLQTLNTDSGNKES